MLGYKYFFQDALTLEYEYQNAEQALHPLILTPGRVYLRRQENKKFEVVISILTHLRQLMGAV